MIILLRLILIVVDINHNIIHAIYGADIDHLEGEWPGNFREDSQRSHVGPEPTRTQLFVPITFVRVLVDVDAEQENDGNHYLFVKQIKREKEIANAQTPFR